MRRASTPEMGATPSRRWALGIDQRRRMVLGALAGAVGAAIVAFAAPWQLTVLVGWDLVALVITATTWMFVPFLDGAATREAASREDLSTATDDLVIIVASIVSLGGVLLALIEAQHVEGVMSALLTCTAVLTVLLSWFTVQTVFLLRYARLYYESPAGGIAFPGDDRPDYLDFAYLAFTIGMTFQVSDTEISSRLIRRTVIRHALIGYLFATVIIGVTINVVGGLIR